MHTSRLKAIRTHSCLSQQELARTSGISVKTIQRIENGQSVGSAYTRKCLAAALQVSPHDLMTSPDETPWSTPVTKRHQLKGMNWSALAVVILPFANLLLPFYLWRKMDKSDDTAKAIGQRILSLQILWTLSAVAAMLLIQMLWLLIMPAGRIPIFLAVYGFSVLVNVMITVHIALLLAKANESRLYRIPNLL